MAHLADFIQGGGVIAVGIQVFVMIYLDIARFGGALVITRWLPEPNMVNVDAE